MDNEGRGSRSRPLIKGPVGRGRWNDELHQGKEMRRQSYRGITIRFRLMQKLLIALIFIGCSVPTEPTPVEITFDITPAFSQDTNGYYHLMLDRNKWQTIQSITGKFHRNGYEPEYLELHWTSSHYWIYDEVGYIVDVWNCYDNNCEEAWEAPTYIGLDTLHITYFNGMEVPTINPFNLSTREINSVFAPSINMLGDTVTVSVEVAPGQNSYGNETIEVILE